MKCDNCRAEVEAARFCPRCGQPVTKARPATPPIPPPPPTHESIGRSLEQNTSMVPPPLPVAPAAASSRTVPTRPTSISAFPTSKTTQPTKGKGLKIVAGLFLFLMALIFGANALSNSDSSGGKIEVNRAPMNSVIINDEAPIRDFSIKQSCGEIYDEYMAAPPGSDEEQWALEAAEEVCFGR